MISDNMMEGPTNVATSPAQDDGKIKAAVKMADDLSFQIMQAAQKINVMADNLLGIEPEEDPGAEPLQAGGCGSVEDLHSSLRRSYLRLNGLNEGIKRLEVL